MAADDICGLLRNLGVLRRFVRDTITVLQTDVE